eukprot:m.1361340 g.1361340  ORF g.1361340 m.1361340 type:complete len:64 (+) comp24941_c0_seq7:452-643(+)
MGVQSTSSIGGELSACDRWSTFILGILLMLCGGTPYMVGLYSHVLKSRLGYSGEVAKGCSLFF